MAYYGDKFSAFRSKSSGQSGPDGDDNYKNLVGMVGTVKDNIFHFKKEDQDEEGQKKWDKLYEYGVRYTSGHYTSSFTWSLLSHDNEVEDGLKLDLKYLSSTTLHILVKLVGDIEPTQEQRRALAAELIDSGMHQSPSLDGGGKRRRKSKKKSKKRRKSKRKSKRRKSTKRKSKRR